MAKLKLVNPFELPGRWFKANLHAHTTVSDGRLSPTERVEQYRRAGYDVLALTDHRRTQDITNLGGGKMLVISGIETHPICHEPKGEWHIVGLGVPREFALSRTPKDANRCIAAMKATGAVVVLAHPAYLGVSYDGFAHLRGLDAIEVWNSTCDTVGRPSSENEWADSLDHGWRLPALAVDDCHSADTGDVCESWTWLKMKAVSVANVLQAVRTGACYASRGPVIHDFRVKDGQIALRCSPVASIQFGSAPGVGRRRRAESGKRITRFAVPIDRMGRLPWKYVRAVVTDEHGRKAWTPAIWPPERQ